MPFSFPNFINATFVFDNKQGKIFTQLRRTEIEKVEVTTLTIHQGSYSLISFLIRVLILSK